MSYKPVPASFTERAEGHGSDHRAGGSFDHPEESLFGVLHSNASLDVKFFSAIRVIKNSAIMLYGNVRPWSEFFDRMYFCAPEGISDAIGRLTTNAQYFYPNYFWLSVLLSAYVLAINISFAICLGISLLCFSYVKAETNSLMAKNAFGGSISVCGKQLSTMKLYGGIGVFALASFYVTGGSSVLFWLGIATIGAVVPHAIFRRPAIVDPAFQFA